MRRSRVKMNEVRLIKGTGLRLRWLKLKHPRAWIRVVQFEREVKARER